MIINNLYQTILIDPALKGADELFMISGYASATFARRHLKDLLTEKGAEFKLNLLIGMPGKRVDHTAYVQLHQEFKGQFKGYYLNESPPVHSKAFAWFSSGKPVAGYSGSANYSQFGFFANKQVNQMTVDDPEEIKAFFQGLISRSVFIPDYRIDLKDQLRLPKIEGSVPPGEIEWIENGVSVRISLLQKDGTVPARSGLNWGQREGRHPDQAYLSIKGEARNEGFLPERGFTFTLVTDDGAVMDCVVAQDARKAIQTTKNNSELGAYFRRRLGVPLGGSVTVGELERYGRTDFTLVKLDDENFQLDFST